MERELCLVLDETGTNRLILKKGSKFEIDKYTSTNFEDSEQIRKKYLKEIEQYLEINKKMLNNPSYRGRIAVVDPSLIGKDIRIYQKRVLYKQHIVCFNELLKSQEIMKNFSENEVRKKENSLVSRFICNTIKYYWNRRSTKKILKDWLKNEKQKEKDYYEIVRNVLFTYEKQREVREYLPTLDEIYKKYKEDKLIKEIKRVEKRKKTKIYKDVKHIAIENIKEEDEVEYFNVNGSKYTIDELHLFDIEDIKPYSEYKPDGWKR